MFCEDLFGSDLIRLLDGKNLDERAERQDSYPAVRSLYTAAAYEKSANIFRMIMLTVGKSVFYKTMNQFFKTYDGQAVTLEDLIKSVSESTKTDLTPYLSWFTESGIPLVTVTDEYDEQTGRYTLKFKTTDGKRSTYPHRHWTISK